MRKFVLCPRRRSTAVRSRPPPPNDSDGRRTWRVCEDELDSITPEQKRAAKIVGLLYLAQMATGVFGEVVARGQLIVPGDASRTVQNIIGHEFLFRLSIVGDLLTYIGVIVLIWAFYVLVRPVHRNLALLALLFRLAENAVLCVATINSLAILKLIGGPEYLKSFAGEQRNALVMLAYHTQGLAMSVGFVLLGLGSMLFACLLWKSDYVPKLIAGWGIFASLLLAASTLAVMAFPGLGVLTIAAMAPMGLYEIGLGLWLLVKGISQPRPSAALNGNS